MTLRATLLLFAAALLGASTPLASTADAGGVAHAEQVIETEIDEVEGTVDGTAGSRPAVRSSAPASGMATSAVDRSAPTLRPPRR